jgi:hypothetical protein
VQPRATLEHTFDARQDVWRTKEDVDYSFLYHTFETGGTSTVTAAASLWDKLLDLSASLGADGLWRSRFDPKPSYANEDEWKSLLKSDLEQDRFTLRSSFLSTLRPLPAIAELSASNLQYRLGLRLYQYSYIETANPHHFGPTEFTWTPANVSEHSVQSSLVFNTPVTTDSLALTAQLAPLTPTYTGLLNLAAGPAKGKVQGGFEEPAGVRQYQPVVVSGTLDFGKPASATEEVQFVNSSTMSRSTSQLALFGYSYALMAERIDKKLVPSTVRLGYEGGGDPVWYWKDRIKTDLSVKTHWYMNLQNYTDNLLDFTLTWDVSIYKFLDLSFSSMSNNSRTYLYFPSIARSLKPSQTPVNLITDLIDSFNFFDQTARTNSSFKIRTITAKAVQHFGDWDLIFQYQGSPQLITTTDKKTKAQTTQYTWSPIFAIQIQWNAVPEIKSNIHGDSTGTFLRGEATGTQ